MPEVHFNELQMIKSCSTAFSHLQFIKVYFRRLESASVPNMFVGKTLVAWPIVNPWLIILGSKRRQKSTSCIYRELATIELQTAGTFLRHWSSNRIDFLHDRMLHIQMILPSLTHKRTNTCGVTFCGKTDHSIPQI